MHKMKLCLDRPLVVEGKYDKNTLSQVVEGVIVTTGGFGIFHKTQLVAYLRRLAEPKGLLVLTDSDAGRRSSPISTFPKWKERKSGRTKNLPKAGLG